MLPIMLEEGKLDLQGGGFLASLNYLGYFIGALSCAAIRVRAPLMVRTGLVATAILLLGMGFINDFTAWSVLRTLAGVMSAWVFVFASGWGLRRLAETGVPTLGGVIFTGPGIGIAVTGLLGGAVGRWGSGAAWIGFGVVALVLIAMIWAIFDDRQPSEPARPADGSSALPSVPVATEQNRRDARWLITLYGLAGFGYIITATFLPVIARQALPGSSWPDYFWPLFGLAIVPGALIGAQAPANWDNRMLLSGAYAMQAAGVLLSVGWPTVIGFGLGSLLLGLPFTALTLFAMREARRLRGNSASGLIGYCTAAYGVGQILGPLFAAPLAQRTGSFAAPLLAAAGVLAFGSILFFTVWRRAANRVAIA